MTTTIPLSRDGSILRALGLALSRDEAGVAHPVAVTATPIAWRRCGWCQTILGVIALERPTPGMFTDTCCPDCRVRFFTGQRPGANIATANCQQPVAKAA